MDNNKTKFIPIDANKLRQWFIDNNLKATKVAEELGCGCAISNAIRRGKIAKPTLMLLESVYGLDPRSIAPCDEKPITKDADALKVQGAFQGCSMECATCAIKVNYDPNRMAPYKCVNTLICLNALDMAERIGNYNIKFMGVK